MKFLALALLLAGLGEAVALTNKVLIIGIDGTMPSAMAVARTPHLDALKSNGCYSVRSITHPVTHSAACWSSMFTGVWGDKHGVNDPGNSFTGNQFARYPSFFKRIEAANSNLNTICFARWSPILTAVPDADVKQSFSTDQAATDATCQRLTNSNPDVFYMILLDVDSAGHSSGWGPNVTNYVRAIEAADTRVGQMIAAMKRRPSYTNENWLVISLTDHGEHDHPDPERSRIVWQIHSGPAAARGVIWPAPGIVDVFATVLTHLGIPIEPEWNVDARVVGLATPPPVFGTNLIFNGNAEWNSGTNNYTTNRGIAWWFDLAGATIGEYGSHTNFPTTMSPGPAERGRRFFLGGTGNNSALQRIDVSALQREINDPGTEFNLSGWFGGYGADGDTSGLVAQFLNSTGAMLGSAFVGNVTAADRTNTTGLHFRGTNGLVPIGTRFVEFVLTNRVVTGSNDGSADNLSFVLTPRPEPEFSITGFQRETDGWRIETTGLSNRVFVLERSVDLLQWSAIGTPQTNEGSIVVLFDTNTTDQVFYRVRRLRE